MLNRAILLLCAVLGTMFLSQATLADPPVIGPEFSINVDGFPGDDGHDAVASCGDDIFYVRFGDRTIRQLRRNHSGAWIDSAFAPQGSSAGFQFMRVFGSGDLLAALYATPYSAHRIDVFERDSAGSWSLRQTINGAIGASFRYVNQLQWSGSSLLVVDRYADSFRGAAFIFDRDANGVWQQAAKLQGSGAFPFYTEVWSAVLDGDRAILGHWLNSCGYGAVSGIAYIFERSKSGAWNEVAALRPVTARCADAYAANVSLRGNVAFASAPGDNVIYRFNRVAGSWLQGPSLPIPLLAGNPTHGLRLVSTGWGLLARTADSRLVAYEQSQGSFSVAGVLLPLELPAADCYCWNAACDGTRVVTMTARPAGGARLAIFDVAGLIDCDGDGVRNADEIAQGATDADADGIPDECQQILRVPDQYPTIQAAIDATPIGVARTVTIAPGTFNQSFSMNGKNVVVRGAPNNATILDGTGLTTSIARFTGGEPATAGVENLVFRNGTSGSRFTPTSTFTIGGAIFANATSAFIRNCRFENCRADYGGAVYQRFGALAWDNCEFVGNIANDEGGGALVYNCSGTISASSFTGNRCGMNGAGSGSGFKAVGSNGNNESVILEGCTLTGNIAGDSGAAVEFYQHTKFQPGVLRLINTTITGNTSGQPFANGAGGLRVLGEQNSCVISAGSVICSNTDSQVAGPYLVSGTATICDCAGDLTGDGSVNGGDLGVLLTAWGAASPAGTGDANHDGVVDGSDLAIVLTNWGPCAP